MINFNCRIAQICSQTLESANFIFKDDIKTEENDIGDEADIESIQTSNNTYECRTMNVENEIKNLPL